MKNSLRYLLVLAALFASSLLMFSRSSSASRENVKESSIGGSAAVSNFATSPRLNLATFQADLSVTKMSSSSMVAAGSNLTYTIEVINLGSEDATSVTLNDQLPADLTFVSLTQSDANWTCAAPDVGSGGTVGCTIQTLPGGSDDTFTLVVKVNPSATPGEFITNVATVSSSDDPNDENNSSSATTQVSGGTSTDIGVIKQTAADTSLADRDVTYTIQVVNGGPSNADNAALNDTLPGNMTFVSLSQPANGWSCTTPQVGSGGAVACTNSSLAVGSNDTFKLVTHIPPGTASGTTYDNTATVSTSTTDDNQENDSSTASVTVVDCPTAAVVLNNQDSGPGSLRQAMTDACPGATITFASNVTGTITLLSALPDIDKNLTITGPGANVLAVQRSTAQNTPQFRIFTIDPGVVAGISGLTISNGKTSNGSGGGISINDATLNLDRSVVSGNTAFSGGGIYNVAASSGVTSTLTITNSTISGNMSVGTGGPGGGVLSGAAVQNSNAVLTITNSTISGNSATSGSGGGIINLANSGGATATATVTNTTVSNNSTASSGGGIINSNNGGTTTVKLTNTIVAGNFVAGSTTADDINGPVDAANSFNNLIGTGGSGGLTNGANNNQVGVANPLLAPLGNYGGPTQTHALLPGSPAINAGTSTGAPSTDQRGVSRVGAVDIGSFESRGFTISAASGTPQTTPINTAFPLPLVATVGSSFNEPVQGGQVTFTAPPSGPSATFTGGVKTFNAAVGASGQASATATANGNVGGPYNVTATANGAASGATFSLTNAKVPTTTAVTSSANPSNTGQSVTFTATVTGTQAGTPTGTVTFKDNGSAITNCTGVALSSAKATCTTSGLAVGNHTITAEYSGDATFDVSSNTLPNGQQVNPSVSIGDVSLTEGDAGTKSFNFAVTLSAASNLTVKVDYQTSDGTATAGSDYAAASGTLTFNPGETQKNVTVLVNGDTLNEPDETFFVTISNPVNSSISTAKATGTIKNDDAQPSLSIGDVAVTEGNSGTTNAVFTVALSAPSGQTVTVNYATSDGTATAGSDYTAASGTLTFNPGDTQKTVTVSVNGDTLNEPDETFFVTLSGPVNATIGTAKGTGTIKNDDGPPSLSVGDVKQAEGDSGTTNFNFTVTLSPQSGQTVTVNYATADGTATVADNDYKAASGTLTFAPGETQKTVTVLVNGDTRNEPDETFFLNLSGAQNASVSKAQGTGTISNDDTPLIQFSASSASVAEGAGRATINVTRTGDPSLAVGVSFATVDDPSPVRCDDTTTKPGVAFARCDYSTTVTTLSFAAGETAKSVNVPVIDDSFVEPAETFQVALSKPTGGAALGSTSTATVTITDNDVAGEPNPILSTPFFVRQQYLDLLSREPETDGFNSWVATLNNCPNPFNTDANSPSAQCDRIHVSADFFLSTEFQLKGFFVFRFYKVAFGRLPHYSEIVADMSSVTGTTTAELIAKKGAFTTSFAQRQEFTDAYGSLTDAQFVAALMDRYSLQSIRTPDPANPDGPAKVTLTRADLVNNLTAHAMTRAQVLRAVSDSDQVGAAEAASAFVAMQYFGYLRRDPDPEGYANWLATINANPANARLMINGFINSVEYRLRFGQP